MFHGLFHFDRRHPVQAAFRVANAGLTVLDVLITFPSVIIAAFHFAESGKRRETISAADDVQSKDPAAFFRQLFDARFVIGLPC